MEIAEHSFISNKILKYALKFKKEYLYIRGINKELKYFVDNIDEATRGLFQNHRVARIKKFIKRFLLAQERGRLQDIGKLFFWKYDILNIIEFYENIMFDFFEYKYARDFHDLFCEFYNRINFKYYDNDGNVKVKECVIDENVSDEIDIYEVVGDLIGFDEIDSILNSDGIDSDEIDSLLNSDSDSDSDSDGIDSDVIDSLLNIEDSD